MSALVIQLAEAQHRVTLVMGHLAAQVALKHPDLDQFYETAHKLREAIGLLRLLAAQAEREGGAS